MYRLFSCLSPYTILPCAAAVRLWDRATRLRQHQQHQQPGLMCCRFKGTQCHWNTSADPAVCRLYDSQTCCLQDHLGRNQTQWNPLQDKTVLGWNSAQPFQLWALCVAWAASPAWQISAVLLSCGLLIQRAISLTLNSLVIQCHMHTENKNIRMILVQALGLLRGWNCEIPLQHPFCALLFFRRRGKFLRGRSSLDATIHIFLRAERGYK